MSVTYTADRWALVQKLRDILNDECPGVYAGHEVKRVSTSESYRIDYTGGGPTDIATADYAVTSHNITIFIYNKKHPTLEYVLNRVDRLENLLLQNTVAPGVWHDLEIGETRFNTQETEDQGNITEMDIVLTVAKTF